MKSIRANVATSTPSSHRFIAQRAPRVLLAEDDEHMRRLIASSLRRDGFEVIEARDGVELLESVGSLVLRPRDGHPVDLVITDIRMPRMSGMDVLAGLRSWDWSTPVILLTAFGDAATHAEARMLGAARLFDKPFDLYDLRVMAMELTGVGGHPMPNDSPRADILSDVEIDHAASWPDWIDIGGEGGT